MSPSPSEAQQLQVLFGPACTRRFGPGHHGDWLEAFACGSTFTIFDVEKVLASEEGENDGAEWICVVQLKSGKYGWLHAGCDNTGWDCRAWGDSHVCDTLADLVNGFVGSEMVQRLGAQGHCLAHEDCLANEALARACGADAVARRASA